MIARLVSLLIGYGFGLFQTASVVGRMHGVDIRKVGSGNPGTTNALRVFGAGAGICVFIGDFAKCMISVLLVRWLSSYILPDISWLLSLYAGFGCILGHDFPVQMHFKGGKGIACTAGFAATLPLQFIPVCLLSFFIPALLTHYVSLGSILLNIILVAMMFLMGQNGRIPVPQKCLPEIYAIILLIAVIAIVRHRENIVRLLNGTERKTYLFGKKKEKGEHSKEGLGGNDDGH